jgi:hypothetical protein
VIVTEARFATAVRNGERTIDANRILTDLLVNFRRIVHRGLVTYSGELWYREGLPSDVFRRLVVRKENETPLDRFSGDYEELMTYANFRDLADIIVGNDVLKDRLTILEPRDGASLLDRLHELEEMRRTISAKKPVGKIDEARLKSYFDEFRSAIKGAKSPAVSAPLKPSESAPKPTRPESEEETLDSIFDEDAPPPPPVPKPGRLVVKVSSSGLHKAAAEAKPRPKTDPPSKPPKPTKPSKPSSSWTSVNAEVGSIETPVTHVSTRLGPDDSGPEGPVEEAERVERALRDGDDAVILKALHVEVTEIADGMLRRDPKHGHVVWEVVGRRGWFEAHRAKFELDPLERFYSLADTFLEAFASGAKSSELKGILADAGFSKMLLELREMFLKSRSRV